MTDKPSVLSSKENNGPLWTPTVQVERLMRECQAKDTNTVLVDRKVTSTIPSIKLN